MAHTSGRKQERDTRGFRVFTECFLTILEKAKIVAFISLIRFSCGPVARNRELNEAERNMKSKSKRSDKEFNKSSLGDRKPFYNPLLVDGSPQAALGAHNKSKSTSRNVSVRDKRVKAEKDNFDVKNFAPDTAEIGSVETITRQEHQSQTIHSRVANDGADINVNTSFVGQNSNETLNTYGSLFAPGNTVLPREEPSTACQEAMVNIGEVFQHFNISSNEWENISKAFHLLAFFNCTASMNIALF